MTIYTNSIEPARCKLCSADIAWALTFPNRKRVPLDRPITSKNLQFDADGHEIAELVSKTHFETCAQYDPATRQAKQKPKPSEQARLF